MTGLADLLGLAPNLVEELLRRYTALGWTIGAAESLTGGLLTAVLTEVPGSSCVVRGGLVVYATDLKSALAGVDTDLLASRGPVDAGVARALAAGARDRCGATVGVGTTGVAGPEPQDGIAVGTWFCAAHGPGRWSGLRVGVPTEAADATAAVHPAGDAIDGGAAERRRIRAAAVAGALDLLAEAAATAL